MAGWPQAFLDQMRQKMHVDEFAAFLASLSEPSHAGLRVNPLKIDAEAWQKRASVSWEGIPWCADGFYLDGETRWGKQPDHTAGLYYLQEPSAMAPVEQLDVQPGMRVLDLCAAPGGKTTQIAAKLQGSGVLVCNDPHPERVKALTRNVERCVPFPVVVMNEQPQRLAEKWAGWFDRILVDAPCSGEGMFRKDEGIRAHWTAEQPQRDAEVQEQVLRAAFQMLKPGGRLVYSTCTYNALENEAIIAQLVAIDSDVRLVKGVRSVEGFESGRSEWIDDARLRDFAMQAEVDLAMMRIWPHHVRGEGHTLAVLEKSVDSTQVDEGEIVAKSQRVKMSFLKCNAEVRQAFGLFLQEVCAPDMVDTWLGRTEHFYMVQDYVYWCASDLPDLSGLKVFRSGMFIGEMNGKKPPRRFVPSATFALALRVGDVLRAVELPGDRNEVVKYLKGETLDADVLTWHLRDQQVQRKGWVLVCTGGYGLGWARSSGDGFLKNDYPVGWRWNG